MFLNLLSIESNNVTILADDISILFSAQVTLIIMFAYGLI